MDSKESPVQILSEAKVADDQTRKICDKVKQAIQLKTARNYVNFEAIAYKTNMMMPPTYFIKVNVGGSDYIHIAVLDQCYPFTQLQYNLLGVQQGKALDDPIDYFPTN